MPDAPNVALLVEGIRATDVVDEGHTLASSGIAEALAGSGRWSIRHAAESGAEHLPSRIGLKQAIRQAIAETTGRLLLGLRVQVVNTERGLAIVTEESWEAFPEDSTLDLNWLRSELRDVESRMILVAIELVASDVTPKAVFAQLDVGRPDRILAVVEGAHNGSALWAGVAVTLHGAAETNLEEAAHDLRTACPGGEIAFHGDALARIRPPSGMTVPLKRGKRSVEPLEPLEKSPAAPPLLGTTLPGRFRLTREIARGAHGVVYAARQLSVNRLVAVKVLNAHSSAEGGYSAANFVDEIQTIGRLDHPNVIRIHQADRTPDGRMFYAMELVKGPTLETLLDQHGPLEAEQAVSLVLQILSGLGAAHAAGVVHSDVKPSNIALQPGASPELIDARPVVFDFGVARLRHNNPHRVSDAIGVSMAYTAPEQAFDGKVDVRSDIFAVGLLFYTMLTGWERGSLNEMVPPLTPTAVPQPDILSILRRALSYEADDRFESAEEFIAAIRGSDVAQRDAATQPPFRYLSGFSEADRQRFHGRVLATAQLTDLVVYNTVVSLVGGSGAGKTSLVRAGLLPRLRNLRAHTLYVTCDADPVADAATALVQGERDLLHALKTWHSAGSPRVVVVFDELETLAQPDRAEALLGLFDAISACIHEVGEGVAFVLVIDDRALSALRPLVPRLASPPPVMRLGPLTGRGATEALLRPLEDRGITIAPDGLSLLMQALSDTQTDDAWTNEGMVNASTLQLLGSLLYDSLADDFVGEISPEQCAAVLPVDTLMTRWLERGLGRVHASGEPIDLLKNIMAAMTSEGGVLRTRNEAELGDIDARCHREILDELVAQQVLIKRSKQGLLPTWRLAHPCIASALLSWLEGR